MNNSRIGRLISRLATCDVAWLRHRVNLALGIRGLSHRPLPLVSRYREAYRGQKFKQEKLPRLLVFSHNLEREGASISLKELICGLKSHHGISSEVIAFGGGPLRQDYEEQGIPVEVMPSLLHRIYTTKRLNVEVSLLAKRIQAADADVVFVNTLLNFPAILAAEEAGLPSIWNPRESEPWDCYFRFLPEPVAQQAIAAIGLPQKVVFVAEATRAVWQDFEHSANFMVIHNALNMCRFSRQVVESKVDSRQHLGWGDEEVVFLCVGTLCERKGQLDSLQAIDQIAGLLNLPIRMVFVGDISGQYAKKVQEYAKRFRRDSRVHVEFVEPVPFIGRYYLAADVFLLCSRIESYPRVILEALAFGLPVISTPVFGVVEQIPDPEGACFYQPGDIRMLSGHMLKLIHDAKERDRMRLSAVAIAGRMQNFEKMLGAYFQVIKDINA